MLKKVLVLKIKFLLCLLVILECALPSSANSKSSKNKSKDSDFFPIAVWLQNPALADEYKANGVNLFVGIHGGLDQEKLNHFKAADMRFICSQNEFALNRPDEPLIYAWMHGDEPDNAQRNRETGGYDPCIDPEIIIADYHKIKEKDPTRPVYLNLGRGVAVTNWAGRGECRGKTDMYKVSNNGYLKGCDIGSFDVYPVNSREEEVHGNLWYVAKGINNLEKWSGYSKPVWCWIETTAYGENSPRKPTPKEVKAEVWMALVNGASGFGYFCHKFHPEFDAAAPLHDPEMREGMKAINQQVTALAKVLNSPNTSGFAMVNSSNSSIPIDIMTKNYDGENYLFSVAMRPGQTEAEFRVSKGTEAEVLGENRTIKIKNGKFTDTFTDYDVHLYKIK